MIGDNAECPARFLESMARARGVVHLKRLPPRRKSPRPAQKPVELHKPGRRREIKDSSFPVLAGPCE